MFLNFSIWFLFDFYSFCFFLFDRVYEVDFCIIFVLKLFLVMTKCYEKMFIVLLECIGFEVSIGTVGY